MNSIIESFTIDIFAHSPELCLFLGFFLQLVFLSLPTKINKLALPFGYLVWAFYAVLFVRNGVTNGNFFSNHLTSDSQVFALKTLVLTSVLLIKFHFHAANFQEKTKSSILFNGLAFGALLLIGSNSYFTFILGLEMMSLASYSLSNFSFDKTSSASSLKYFIFGAASTAICLFGISWVYGFTGSLFFRPFENDHLFFSIALLFVFTGLTFKMSSFPVHHWVPKVYENSPNLVLSVFSTLPKIAAGFVLIKLHSLFQTNEFLTYFLATMAMATIIVGTMGATVQKNFKNMMGYSSIANSGFFLAIVLLSPQNQLQAFWIFAISQAIANVGVFYLLDAMQFDSMETQTWKGQWKKSKWMTAGLAVCLISLIGLPPFAGFSGKFLIIIGLFSAQSLPLGFNIALASTLIISTLFSLYFYLMPIYRLAVQENEENILPVRFNWLHTLFTTLIIVSLVTIFFKVGELGNYIYELK